MTRHSVVSLVAAAIVSIPGGIPANGEPVRITVEDRTQGGKRTALVALGDDITIEWNEKLAFKVDDQGNELTQWPKVLQFGLHWDWNRKNLPFWRQGGNWDASEWIKIPIGNVDGLWNGRLRVAGCCRRERDPAVDFFWEYPRGSNRTDVGLIHARFLRRPDCEYLYARIAMPDAGDKPVRLILAAMPLVWQLATGPYYQNVLYTPTEHRALFTRLGTDKEEAWDNINVDQSSPMILACGIDFLHGGAGLVYLPEEVAAIRAPPNSRDVVVELTLKPGIRVVHLGFWEYMGMSAPHAMKTLMADQENMCQVLRDPTWQTSRAEDVLLLDSIRSRLNEFFTLFVSQDEKEKVDLVADLEDIAAPSLLDGAARVGDNSEKDQGPKGKKGLSLIKLRDLAKDRLDQAEKFMQAHPVITDDSELCRLYELRDDLLSVERELQNWYLAEVEQGRLPRAASTGEKTP